MGRRTVLGPDFNWKAWGGYVLLLMFFCCVPLFAILRGQYVKTTQVQSPGDVLPHEMIAGDVVQQRLFFDGDVQELSFWVANGLHELGYNSGTLKVTLQQGEQSYTQFYDISQMGDWVYIPLAVGKGQFGAGEALLTFKSLQTEPGRGIYLPFSSNPEGCLPAQLNGAEQSGPLILRYEEHLFRGTFLCSLLWMLLMVCLICCTAYLLMRGGKGKWLFFSVAGIMFCVLCIRSPLLTYQAEFFWETGEDFFNHARADSFFENLMALESGFYLSWLTRLIAFFWVKVVGAVRFAPLVMQLTAVVLSIIWCAFPCLDYFQKYAARICRVILSLTLFFVIPASDYMYTYISFTYSGVLFLAELYLMDLNALKRWQFVLCCSLAALILMTKMQYVAVIPIAVVLLFLFWKIGFRWRLYSSLLILVGLGQVVGTLALSGAAIHERASGFASIHFKGIADLINSVIYQMVQLYSTTFGGNGETSNYLFLVLIIALAIICVIRLIRSRGRDICAWMIVLAHLLIAATFAVHRLSSVSAIAASDVVWSQTWSAAVAWRLPGWIFTCSAALILSGLCVLHWLFREKSVVDQKKVSIACIAFLALFLWRVPHMYEYTYQSNTRGYATAWADYAPQIKNESYAILLHDVHSHWYVMQNSRILPASNSQEADNRCTVSLLPESELQSQVLAIYARRTLTEVGLDYVAKFYNPAGQLLAVVPQTNAGGRNVAGFYLDEPTSGVSRMEFELEDGSRAYVGEVDVAVVDIPAQEGGS